MQKNKTCILLCILILLMGIMPSTLIADDVRTATAVAAGFGGEVSVTVSVSGDKIVDISATGAGETPGIGSLAIDQLPALITDAQSIAIDGVTSATVTSDALLLAAKEALLAAGMSEEAITAPVIKEAAVAGEAFEKTADIVVIGAGGAGMSAALEAANLGASVIVLDKMAYIGGNTLLAGSAMNASHPTIQATQTMPAERVETIESLLALEPNCELMSVWQKQITAELNAYKSTGSTFLFDSTALHKLQTYVGGDYVGTPELIEIMCDQAIGGVYWLENLGTIWKDEIVSAYGSTWTRSYNPTMDLGTAGAGFVNPQRDAFLEKGGELLVGHKAEELVMADGRVVGVKGQTADGTPFTIHANKSVILATGGFSANEEMREQYNEQWSTLRGLNTTNPSSSTGDGIIMAEAAGANLVGMGWIQLIPYSANQLTATIDGSIYLDNDGKRFIAEDERRDVIAAKTIDHNDGVFYWLVDKKTIIDELNGVSIYGKVIADSANGTTVFYADTLEEIAAQSGLDYDTMMATLAEYNASVESGHDPIGRQNLPQTIGEGPFCLFLNEIMVHHTMGGVQINTHCEVIGADGEVIPGLYAAGEITGGIHGANRLGGNAITDIVVFGRIAGKNAAK